MVRIAVLGTGSMGSQHVRVLSELPDAEIVALCDADRERLQNVAKQFKVPNTYADFITLLEKEKPEAVTIALPTKTHKEAVLMSMKHNCHVLVEKPIAYSMEDAEEMMTKAKDADVIFTVGHVERFNPMVQELKKRLENKELGDVYLINTIRAGPFPKRLFGQVEGVLIDLAAHDVDIIQYLVGNITGVFSQLIFSGKQEIYAKALFKINKQVQGSSEFSWVSPKRVRKIEVYGTAGILSGDYQDQTLTFYENGDVGPIDPLKNYYEQILLQGYIKEGAVHEILIQRAEPLKLELQHFLECVQKGQKPLVSPEEATKALNTALRILQSGKESRPITLL